MPHAIGAATPGESAWETCERPAQRLASEKAMPGGTAAAAPGIKREKPRISEADFRELLMSCVASGASDITIQSDQQPRAEINGVLRRVTRRPWAPSEVDMVLAETFGSACARTEISGRKILDYAYEIALGGSERQRFRVNATGIFGRDGCGVEITLRTLPSKTPDFRSAGLSERETQALSPEEGIVIIAGATGSGKSTTMAAVTRGHLESSARPVKIVDIQAPIEFTFRDIDPGAGASASVIGQSEVGRHITGFAEGVRAALRRKPHIINVGEARDMETVRASLEASLTGHLVYTTTHSGSAANTVRRLLAAFPSHEREARGYDLVSALRFILVQRLLPRRDAPGRIPIRECLEFTEPLRRRLLRMRLEDWPLAVHEEIHGGGPGCCGDGFRLTFAESARGFMDSGALCEADAARLSGSARLDRS